MGFLFLNNKQLDLLTESQNNLKSSQENLERTAELFREISNERLSIQKTILQNQKVLAASQKNLDSALSQHEENSSQNTQYIELLRASQENLEATQRSISHISDFYEDKLITASTPVVPDKPAPDEPSFTPEEKRRVAYALNSCTVSVSQIIDYDDIYILEQEYESILNNLNLEIMPKDESLLDVLTQLLNVITFFRIQEGDKSMLEQEYQQRIRNAIWSAVPNIGVLISGGGVAAISSLVSQIGIGYMNYRREKANTALDYDKEKWKLTRSAMEQFNALRRELFDAAWRLADKYNFPDEYRITERQISVYNRILTEPDPLKRFERLEYIQDRFLAYPPFTYYLGSAANAVALCSTQYDAQTKANCAKKAARLFEAYLSDTNQNLFREDQIRASCALEYFDLLFAHKETDIPKLQGLLDIAISAAGNSFDVLELCAFDYIKLNCLDKAAHLLRMLVNEGYNTTVNAQFLSSLYVHAYVSSKSPETKILYDTLAHRITKAYLFPFPNTSNDTPFAILERDFLSIQKQILLEHYADVIRNIIRRYTIQFNKCLPTSIEDITNPEQYFEDNIEFINIRKANVQNALKKDPRAYRIKLQPVVHNMMDLINKLCVELSDLPLSSAEDIRYRLQQGVQKQKDPINIFLKKACDSTDNATPQELDPVMNSFIDISFESITSDTFTHLAKTIIRLINQFSTMREVSNADIDLRTFCRQHDIDFLESESDNSSMDSTSFKDTNHSYITMDLLGENAAKYHRNNEINQKMEEYMHSILQKDSIITEKGKRAYVFYPSDSADFRAYFKRHKPDLKYITGILAILNQQVWPDEDWIFTGNGIHRYGKDGLIKKDVSGAIPYKEIHLCENNILSIGPYHVSTDSFDLSVFFKLLKGLADIEQKYSIALCNSQNANSPQKESLEARIYHDMINCSLTNQSLLLPSPYKY